MKNNKTAILNWGWPFLDYYEINNDKYVLFFYPENQYRKRGQL